MSSEPGTLRCPSCGAPVADPESRACGFCSIALALTACPSCCAHVPGREALLPLRGRGGAAGGGSGRSQLPRVPRRARRRRRGRRDPRRMPRLRRLVGGYAVLRAHLHRARAAGGRASGFAPLPQDAAGGGPPALLALPRVRPPDEPPELRPGLGGGAGRVPRPRRVVQPRRADADRGLHPGGRPGSRAGTGEDRAPGGARATTTAATGRGGTAT